MKRLVYTGLLMFGLLAAACQKEDIQPNLDDSRDFSELTCGSNCGNRSGNIDDPSTDGGGNDGNGIVDPNGEEEGSDKPGTHNQN